MTELFHSKFLFLCSMEKIKPYGFLMKHFFEENTFLSVGENIKCQ